jgi:hypothetical protein
MPEPTTLPRDPNNNNNKKKKLSLLAYHKFTRSDVPSQANGRSHALKPEKAMFAWKYAATVRMM